VGIQSVASADAGPLIHLDELGAVDLLGVFAALVVTDVVFREVTAHRPAFAPLPTMETAAFDVAATRARFPHLQLGEVSALAACRERGIQVLLTDDLAARDAAHAVGVVPVGSIGIVLLATKMRRVAVERGESLLRALGSESTLFTTPSLIDAALRALRAAP
jgi:predicted nucleic acid-binding protein